MMEFKMTTDLQTALPAEIGFNFEELKHELSERLDYYRGLVVTEDTIKESKADRANLNKLREAVDDRRKEIKKACMAPYTAFEAKVKELTALIDEPIAAIDSQLKEYEEIRREEKRKQIAQAYETIVPEALREIIPMTFIFSPKWLNATTTMKSIEEELTARVKRTNADMMVIDTVEPEYQAAVRATYIRTLDIEKAMAQKEELQKAAEAFRQREEAKAAREAERAAQASVAPQAAPRETTQETDHESENTESVYLLRLELQVTKDQARLLKRFLQENNINHTKI